MERFLSAIRAQAATVDRTIGQARFATVSSFNASNFTARVVLQPDGVLTGWLPVLSCWTGPSWGMICPLDVGDQVFVLPQEGDAEHGVIVGRAFSDKSPPPEVPGGEFWIAHRSGTRIRLRNDGTVLIEGDLHVGGRVFDQYGALDRLRSVYNAHTHLTASGSQTSGPATTDSP